MEAFKAARVLIKEISAFYHDEDMEVLPWGHAFVYHPSEVNLPKVLQESFPKNLSYGRWVHLSALVERLYSVKYQDFHNLPFHTRGFVRMVPHEYWASILILAAIIKSDLQMTCDEHSFLWARSLNNDFKRPHPAFPPTDYTNPTTNVEQKVQGDGEIDIQGAITAHEFAYIVCTMYEVHEVFDTLFVRQGGASTDTFICFTSRYPVIFFADAFPRLL